MGIITAIRKKTAGSEDEAIHFGIGQCLSALGRYEEALREEELALAIAARNLGRDDDPALADFQSAIAGVLTHLRRYDEASRLLAKALAGHKLRYGPTHTGLSEDLSSLAMIDLEKGKHAAAVERYRKALLIDEEFYGSEHPETATSRASLGYALIAMGNTEAGLRECLAAMPILEERLGSQHAKVGLLHFNIGVAYLKDGRRAAAESALRKAVDAFAAALPKGHPDRAKAEEALRFTRR